MKNLLLAFVAMLSISATKPSIHLAPMDLKTAVEKNLVTYELQGNPDSPHYYQPISLTITSNTDKTLLLKIPNGQQFISNEDPTQDLILVQEELLAVKPNETREKQLFAMCTQHSNSAPGSTDLYTLGNSAEGALKQIAEEIQKKKAFNTIGQYSIWNATDNYGLLRIEGFNTAEANHFRNFVANAMDLEIPIEENVLEYEEVDEPHRKLVEHIVGGEFNFSFRKASDVTIGMFNDRNVIVKELFNQPQTEPGKHNFTFEFDTMQYTEKNYYIRLIINGQIKVNYKVRRDS